MGVEELNKIIRTLSNRVSIYLRGEQATLNALYEQYGANYQGVEITSLLSNIQNMKKYNMELVEISEMVEKLAVPTKESFTTLAPSIVSLFNDLKKFKSDVKVGNVLVAPTIEELNSLEQALKIFLSNKKSLINESQTSNEVKTAEEVDVSKITNDNETTNNAESAQLSNLEIFRAKRKKYDEDSYFTRAIAKLRYVASKEVGGSSNAR